MLPKRKFAVIFIFMLSLFSLYLVYSPVSQAQNWAALPPYNTLWPLWAPALSPIDPVTGLPVPIVSQLRADTFLPVQPGLTWDPAASNPWLLYNTPLGMAYYDPIGGVNMWPPSYLLDSSGSPSPLALPPGYGYLPPVASTWFASNLPVANVAALSYIMGLGIPGPFFTPPLAGVPLFLAPSAFFAPPSAFSLVPPPPPVPTAFVPTILFPPPIPTAITPLVPTLLAPIVPTQLVPTALTPIVPTQLVPTSVVPAAISGFLYPFG